MVPCPQSDVIRVEPPLSELGRAVVRALAGAGDGAPARIWPGQPRSRSPWLPCPPGCCLVPASGAVGPHRATWLRFLIRDVLAPRSAQARARAGAVGLVTAHRLDGVVVVEDPSGHRHRVAVVGNRVSDHASGPDPGLTTALGAAPTSTQHRRVVRRRAQVVQLGRPRARRPPDPA